MQIAQQLAHQLNLGVHQVEAAIKLLDDGATVPFIARYRKEATQGLDDGHLRQLAKQLTYLRDLQDRKQAILTSISQQGKLTTELKNAIDSVSSKTELEDLYLPFKPKRKTKGQIAIAAGLLPLAEQAMANPQQALNWPQFVNEKAGFADEESIVQGVLAILAEQFAESAKVRQALRQKLQQQGMLQASAVKAKATENSKYRDYFNHQEAYKKVASHRVLAMLRGKNEGELSLNINLADDNDWAEQLICTTLNLPRYDIKSNLLVHQAVRMGWRQKLQPSLTTELLATLREKAEHEAIGVFAANLKDVLMAAPAGAKVTLAIDPGYRTGCKIAIVDTTGKLLATTTIFPHEPQNNWDKSKRTLVNLCRQHKVELIAIGNGTASRESDKLAAEVIADIDQFKIEKVLVSEAGASVYSASEYAAQEFPELDVSLRGAVSIARRLQDPLAELVKIEPKAIGVGQYQHDVSQSALSESLNNCVEDCVNAVGVDLNIASVPLLAQVAGLNKTIAQNIVAFRDKHGRFNNRKQLLEITRLGPKAYEQSAGFLRIFNGDNPLDATAVHPESYDLVEKLLEKSGLAVTDILGNTELGNQFDQAIAKELGIGEYTFNDILAELEKPSRDPRPEFKTATFKAGVEKISDLKLDMILEGVVTNVANFGAFVDIGVHQDGLVHISSLTNKFVSDPREVVKAGDVVKVKVIELDIDRKRIGLTMRLEDKASSKSQTTSNKPKTAKKPHQHQAKNHPKKPKAPANAAMGNAFAEALAKLKQN